MPRLAIKLEYCGKSFSGSQMQRAGLRTVQSELERGLGIFFRTRGIRVPVTLSGRTDAGVHADGQIAHFDIAESAISASGLAPELSAAELQRMCWALNGILGQDLSITSAKLAADRFHARYSACRRTYVYRILNRPQRSALEHGQSCFVPAIMDVASMQRASTAVIGTHDFVAFKSSNADTTDCVCTVERSELLSLGEGKLEFWISADHFVYNMVRIIVGTLLDIGLGKRPETALSEALSSKDRQQAGPTAPARGLCLKAVDYPTEFNYFAGEPVRTPDLLKKSGDLES